MSEPTLAGMSRAEELDALALRLRAAPTLLRGGGELVAGVRVLPLVTPTLPPATHTNCYIVGQGELAVIDPGASDEGEQRRLMAYLDELESGGAYVREVWLTHAHPDHVGAAAAVRARYGARLLAQTQLGGVRVDASLIDGEVLERGPCRFVALHTPGHAREHLCFFDAARSLLLSGDVVVGEGTVVVAPPEGHMGQYLATLERLRALAPRFVFPAHGPLRSDGVALLSEYIEHRRARERAIVLTLAASGAPMTAAEIVPQVYTDVPRQAWPLAAYSVLAHLEALVEDGRARAEGSGRFTLGGLASPGGGGAARLCDAAERSS